MEFFLQLTPQVQAAVVAAVVALLTTILATPLRFALDKRSVRHKLKTEYEYEERKKLRQLIGRYHGRLLEAAESLGHRLWNLYAHEKERWLDIGGDYGNFEEHYYFRTTLYRFLHFCSLSRLFEAEAIFIDSRIAQKSDLEFVKFLKALDWTATDVALFDGLDYDSFHSTDHFFRDQLREICDSSCVNGRFPNLKNFPRHVNKDSYLSPVLHFFDGLSSNEGRFRWDRMVCFHLFLMGFINTFGYDMQRSNQEHFKYVTRKIVHPEVKRNLAVWIPRLGLGKQPHVKLIMKCLT